MMVSNSSLFHSLFRNTYLTDECNFLGLSTHRCQTWCSGHLQSGVFLAVVEMCWEFYPTSLIPIWRLLYAGSSFEIVLLLYFSMDTVSRG